jgi:hypothetical protein
MLEMIDGVNLHRLVLPLPLAGLSRKFRQCRALANSLLSRKPSKAHYLLNRSGRQRFSAAQDSVTPDVVVLNGADLLPLADQIGDQTKCVLISHNVETNIIDGQVSALRAPALLRQFLQRDVEKTRHMETEGSRRMALVIAISYEDALWYQRVSPDVKVVALPGAFDYDAFQGQRPPVARPLQLGFLAKMSWWPNRQGAEWFATSVLPRLATATVEAHFFGPGSEAFDGRSPALRGHGFVKNLDTVWSSAHFMLCPILAGSGINIKLIESLYNRVPVLATPHACRGLPPIDDPALAIVPPEEWPEFLQSDRALALASETVRLETAELFSARRQAVALAAMLKGLSHSSASSD